MKKLLFIFAFISISSVAFAQFTFSGEFRPRTELWGNGYKTLTTESPNAILAVNQRTRLNFDYKSEGYRFFVSLQDVRIWGQVPQLKPQVGPSTYLHQAYAEIFWKENLTIKTGRQEIIYDDHRIFGSVGWAPQARSHDATIFKYKGNGFKADLGFAFNLNAGSAPNYRAFQYLWLHKNFDNIKFSFLALNNGKEYNDANNITKTRYSQTIGTRTGYKSGNFGAFVNFYYQMGLTPDSTKINATLFGLDLNYKISKEFKVGLTYERQSGNDQVAEDNNEQNAFTPFYGTNHKFNGHMDYFYVANHGGSVGLQDIVLKLNYKKGKAGFGLQGHYFLTAANLFKDANEAWDAGLGTEIDLSMSYPLAKGVGFKVGYSQMFGTETMQALKGGDYKATSNWAWMMISIKPTFLKKD